MGGVDLRSIISNLENYFNEYTSGEGKSKVGIKDVLNDLIQYFKVNNYKIIYIHLEVQYLKIEAKVIMRKEDGEESILELVYTDIIRINLVRNNVKVINLIFSKSFLKNIYIMQEKYDKITDYIKFYYDVFLGFILSLLYTLTSKENK